MDGQGDGAAIGVRDTWLRWPGSESKIAAIPPWDDSADWSITDRPALIEDSHGNLLCIYAAKFLSDDAAIIVKSYNQNTDTGWVDFASLQSVKAVIGTNDRPRSLDAFRMGEVIYIAVQAPPSQKIWIFQMRGKRPGDAIIELVTPDPITFAGVPKHVAATHLPGGGGLIATSFFSTNSAGLGIAQSSDLRTWKGVAEEDVQVLAELSQTSRVAKTGGGEVSAMSAYDLTSLPTSVFAVTTGGRILFSNSTGKVWRLLKSPARETNNLQKLRVALRGIHVVSPSSPVVAYGVGDGGLVLKTEDGGSTWKVVAYGAGEPEDIWDANDLNLGSNLPDIDLLDCYFTTPQRGVVVGRLGFAAFTADGGANWTHISENAGTGDYTGVILENGGSEEAILCIGTDGVHDAIESIDDRTSAAVLYRLDVNDQVTSTAYHGHGESFVGLNADNPYLADAHGWRCEATSTHLERASVRYHR